MWLLADLRSTAPFSLRASTATSSGGKTNLIPSMYALKMALVDAAFRAGEDGERVFNLVKGLRVRFRPPEWAVVNNSFIKILREPKEKKAGPAFISSVAYREFVFYAGELAVALDVDPLAPADLTLVSKLLWHIHYLGKRGGFVQIIGVHETRTLDSGFTFVPGDAGRETADHMVIQYLDDVGPGATFAAVNTFSEDKARLHRDRILVPVGVPYIQVASSRGYTLFRRVA